MTILINLTKLVLIALTVSKSFGDDFDNTITNESDKKDFNIKLDIKKKKSLRKEEKNKLSLEYTCKNNLNKREVKHDVNDLTRFLTRTFERATDGSKYSSQDAEIVLNTVNECKFNIMIVGASEFTEYKEEIIKVFKEQVEKKKEKKKEGSPSNIPDGMKQEMKNMVDIEITISSSEKKVDKRDVGRSGKVIVKLIETADPKQINLNDEDTMIDTAASVGDITKNITGDEKTVEDLVKQLEKYSDLKVKLGVTFDVEGEITQDQLNDVSTDIKEVIDSVSKEHKDGTPISGKILLFRDWNEWTQETEEDLKDLEESDDKDDKDSVNENNNDELEDSEDPELIESISPNDDFSSNGSQSSIVAILFFIII